MIKKQERDDKVKAIMKIVKSDVGEDTEFFEIYEKVIADMNFEELDMELELLKKGEDLK